ncbi:MAG: exodeoxyribonuclease VII large subunit [Burkholderiales bacterium]|nr:exodeoxyribonuclease VII large subunit [Burkholderiales bacterium]
MDNLVPKQPLFDFENESVTVSALNKLAKTLLENNLPIFWIKGEVSGLKIYNHAYFDLKDEGGKISCVMFAKPLALQSVKLENGIQVEVRGRVTLYVPNGSYQINVERIRAVGMGELWEAYQRLINKLKIEGLFDVSFKKALPKYPQAVGVITSKEGAVIRDVITTLKRRAPGIKIVIYNTMVQGRDAGMQIAKAIKTANLRNEVNVLIVCRGGGSMQDLWCFNEEVVAREVFAGHIPLVSAVGHETDSTIIDFVADLRAPTPTAAAELVAKSYAEWGNLLKRLSALLNNNMNLILNNKKQQVDVYYLQLKMLNPLSQFKEKLNQIKIYKLRLQNGIRQIYKRKSQQLFYIEKQLNLVSPTNVLERGYAIVKNINGQVVYNSDQVANQEVVEIILSKDSIKAEVIKPN